MRVLLDTHAFLWIINGDSRVSKKAEKVFLDNRNIIYFSAASLWEICIKISLGKLILADDCFDKIQNELDTNMVQWLPVEMSHCAEITRLPFHHRDPFDRMLVAQALVEKMTLLTRDRSFSKYKVHLIW
jgi:PIN domain nuclease of toxin-antitoxin system